MIIGSFCVFMTFIFLLVLLFNPELRREEPFVRFAYWSAGLGFGGLLLFGVLMTQNGLMQLGAPQTLSFPQDVLARGIVGGVVMLVGVLGVLSPVWAALLTMRQYNDGD